jgi:hypothetical protein
MTSPRGASAAPAALAPLFFAALAALAGCAGPQIRLSRPPLPPRGAPGSPGPEDYAEALVARAHELKLAESEEWRRLGHYRPRLLSGFESEADGLDFFLSPEGKGDPSAELDATLRGFAAPLDGYEPAPPGPRSAQHPICQFPARFFWLSSRLGVDPSRLPSPQCARFLEFHDKLQAESISIVFSAYYLNNPASAFGHTFLRVRKRNPLVPEERRELLDFTIEFAADPDTNFAPIYAVKGLAGAFPGTFRQQPYYYKVRQYNDFESRDLWEFKLALSDVEREMLVAHAWELGSTYFDYFYLTENCSYHLLGLLEAAAPRVHLLGRLHWPVIPADTVKALFSDPGFVVDTLYRPSSRTKFRHALSKLSPAQRDAVERVAADPATRLPFGDRESIQVLDAAQDLLDLRYAQELAEDEHTGTGARLKQRVSERRAEILAPSGDGAPAAPRSKMPQAGHPSRRVSIGLGSDLFSRHPFLALGGRLALHDLADASDGFPELAQLEFLPARARYDAAGGRLELDQLDLAHVLSLTSQDRFDRHTSWEFRVGSERISDAGCRCYAGHVQFGGGLALSTPGERATVFALAQSHVWAGPGLRGIAGAPVRAGIGPGGGLRLRLSPRLVALATGEWIWLPAQAGGSTFWASATVRWELLRELALDAEVRDQNGASTAALSLMVYF